MKTLIKVLMTASLLSVAAVNSANAEMMDDDCKGKMSADCKKSDGMKSDMMKSDGMQKDHMMKSDEMKNDKMMKSEEMKNGKM